MKKKWMTAFACVLIYFLSFGVTAGVMGTAPQEREMVNAEIMTAEPVSSQPDYLVKEHNGVIAVFLNGESQPMIQTDIYVNGLRQTDRELIKNGIALESYTDVLCLLEDFDS